MTDAEVRVNGNPAGQIHQGAFYRFSYDITSLLKAEGENLLEVKVAKQSANKSVNAAERRADWWCMGASIVRYGWRLFLMFRWNISYLTRVQTVRCVLRYAWLVMPKDMCWLYP